MLILAVDDDQDDLELFQNAVRELDSSIHIIVAYNGVEALDFLQKKAVTFPDFIFLDINMPKLDGRECLRAIRSDMNIRHLPVIVYSTSFSALDRQLFKDLNARFLTKSPSYPELVLSLKQLMAELKAKQEAPATLIRSNSSR